MKSGARQLPYDQPSTSRQAMAFQFQPIPDDQPSTSRQALGIPVYDSDEYETDRRSSSPEVIYVETNFKRQRVSTPYPRNETPVNIQVNHEIFESINLPAEQSRIESTENVFNHLENGTTLEEAHSNNHQLKILMLMLKYGVEKRHSFAIATDVDKTVEKCDDVVFRYQEPNGKFVYRFMRAKHKKHTNRVVTFKDLLTEKDKKFSLQKHFNLFRKIQRNPLFEGHELKDYVICTNIGIDRHLQNYFNPITSRSTDEILTFEHEETQCLKFRYKDFPKHNELISKLIKSSDCDRLARKLAKYVKNKKRFDLKGDIFRTYHRALREYVIKEETVQERRGRDINAKFNHNFLIGYLPESAKNFRNTFYKAYQECSGGDPVNDQEEFWRLMKSTKLTMSYSFKTYFELNDDPQIIYHKLFAKEIAEEMSRAKDGIIRIERRSQLIKDNIDKLAGYVFITKSNIEEEDMYYFSTAFFQNKRLPGNLEDFKKRLKKELSQKSLPFNKDAYKFHINNFKTCDEAVVYSKSHLPDDNGEMVSQREIDYFFDKLVLVINQPIGNDLSQIISRKINKYFNFSHDAIARSIPDHIQLWLNSKKGRFLSYKDGESFFKNINLLIPNSDANANDSTPRNSVNVESSGNGTLVGFKEDMKELQRFLISKETQIFNLISSSQSIKLRAFKVLRMVKTIPNYQTNDKLIFEHLSSILQSDRVINDFNSETKNHLLIIVCDAEEAKYVLKLVVKLYPILEDRRNKKIIIIARDNDELAEAFRNIYSGTKKYKEMKDEKVVSLIDLPEDLQRSVLRKGKFIFQVGDVNFDLSTALSEDESLNLLGKIIKGDQLYELF